MGAPASPSSPAHELLARLRETPLQSGPGLEEAARDINALLVSLRGEEALHDRASTDLAGAEAGGGVLEATLDFLADGRLDEALETGLDLEAYAALGEALAVVLEAGPGAPSGEAARRSLERRAHAWLDVLRRPAILRRVKRAGQVDRWMELTLRVIDASRFTVSRLLRQRVEAYGPRTLFREATGGEDRNHTWIEVGTRVDQLARGLLALLDEHGRAPVAILSENRYEMALVDLACLSTGLVNLMISAQATDDHVAYILEQARASVLVVSTEEQYRKVERHRAELPELRAVVLLDRPSGIRPELLSLGDLVARGRSIDGARLERERESVDLDALATLMYTSGTTGKPKGIRFSQRNIVSKRFARAFALPEIGEQDVFLCYLPLFHTFGRYLEMMGCLFWGATYVFLEDPSLDTLRETMRRIRPTVFISVPKKWIQLWEEIGRRADLEEDSEEKLRAVTREVVGDRLRWGLSAAGYLAPEIFRFFQEQGVELMSGFGMTEATGGITMTPPEGYREDTLGVPLPGIEVRLDPEGEMMIRGPYVMQGYYETPESGLDEEGWLRTGDLMETDEAGYYRLVDRKKEIYKNVKGESVAPQRVENLFRDFEAVKRVFLVGDHRPYNTVLIVPNPDYEEIDLLAMEEEERRDYFRSLVVSVNRFLAPFERIVDFAILDRDFDAERGELTPKLTYRRKEVARNLAPVIDTLYRRVHLQSPELGVEIDLPNWLFQALGLTAGDVRFEGDRIALASHSTSIVLRSLSRSEEGEILRVGSCRYLVRQRVLDLGALLATPALWLGNEALVRFAPLGQSARTRRTHAPRGVQLLGRAVEYRPDETALELLHKALSRPHLSLDELDLAARMLGAEEDEHGLLALRVIGRALRTDAESLRDEALLALRSAADSASPALRRRALQILLPVESDKLTPSTLARFLTGPDVLLDENTIALLCEEGLSVPKLEALVRFAETTAEKAEAAGDHATEVASSVLQLLAEYGSAHPARFEELRSALARIQAFAASAPLREEADRCLDRLTEGFRTWLGPAQRIAVDPEEGTEYRWEDVVTFEEEMNQEDGARILQALSRTSLLREAVFLFSGEAMLRLSDIPPGGIWVSLLGEKHGKAVYRVTAHTRLQGSYDMALNLNRDQTPEEIADEVRWLLVTGAAAGRRPLVEKFGGYWEEFDLWSEEFIAGETLDRVVQRLARKQQEEAAARLRVFWPFAVWAAAGAFIDFWNRSGRRYVLDNPSSGDVIVPTHDYQMGTRVISISGRRPAPPLGTILDGLFRYLVVPIEERHPALEGLASPDLILSAFLEVVGVEEGLALLRAIPDGEGPVTSRIASCADGVEARGFIPRRLHSAIERYHRWAELAPDAPPAAQARTARDLVETNRLGELNRDYPDVRVRFFRETVFQAAPEAVARGLDTILETLRRRPLEGDELVDRLTALRAHMQPGSPEEYFLTRLTYPHLRPGDEAGFLSTQLGGVRQTDIVVSLEDNEGRPYRVRQPVSPKEVGRLHRLFLAAKLDVQFRPEHQYLVAINPRGVLIGGMFYEVDEENRTAQLEKIAVAERYRKLGLSDGLMNEFFNRLRAAGIEAVSTGFFRPSYFYRFGFGVGKRQAGLVKML